MATLNHIIKTVTKAFVFLLDSNNPPPPADIEETLLEDIQNDISLENANRAKGNSLKAPCKLNASQIADIMLKIHHIVRVNCAGPNSDESCDILAIYLPEEGIYTSDEDVFKLLALEYNYSATPKELKDIVEIIRIKAPRVERTEDRDLITVNNGIFNFATKELMPFSPDYVFLSKSKVNYNPKATNVVIHNDEDATDWDVESWLAELSDDSETVQLIWEILSAIVRPMVRWNKSAWLYSEMGCNGKGTLCELMRNLVGEGSYATIPLSDFGKDFALEPLIRSSAIIVDENDVGSYVDKAANLKAVITGDVISINRKFKTAIAYQPRVFMVQCLNEYPRIKDRSESFYRRQLFIPFTKSFKGQERKYIKEDYLYRPEVLEYVLFKVLNMNHYKLSEPEACKLALDEYKTANDPIRVFLDEMLPQFVWDLVPYSFLYALYLEYMKRNNPKGSPESKNKFTLEVRGLISGNRDKYSDWTITSGQTRPGKRMNNPEHLIAQFNLIDWKNPTFTGGDLDKICTPMLATKYEGLLRIGNNFEQEDE